LFRYLYGGLVVKERAQKGDISSIIQQLGPEVLLNKISSSDLFNEDSDIHTTIAEP
jgi:hypothetical protein